MMNKEKLEEKNRYRPIAVLYEATISKKQHPFCICAFIKHRPTQQHSVKA